MPRTYSSINKIRGELPWVNETSDPTNAAASTFDVVKKLDTGPEHVRPLSQRSSGRFAGITTARLAVNMDGVGVNNPGDGDEIINKVRIADVRDGFFRKVRLAMQRSWRKTHDEHNQLEQNSPDDFRFLTRRPDVLSYSGRRFFFSMDQQGK
jgi:hypothetical protein